uniref:Uncharacterized protein n=1 Tax=Cucumis melo TaxID=3656 RepID=A0A9I9E496_CUCME
MRRTHRARATLGYPRPYAALKQAGSQSRRARPSTERRARARYEHCVTHMNIATETPSLLWDEPFRQTGIDRSMSSLDRGKHAENTPATRCKHYPSKPIPHLTAHPALYPRPT